MTERKLLVGLSLSFCIKEILEGKVKEDDVFMIFAGTTVEGWSWRNLAEKYKELYWQINPEEGRSILHRLLSQGKIVQPLLKGFSAPFIGGGQVWMTLGGEA